MTTEQPIESDKRELRKRSLRRRLEEFDKPSRSQQICQRLGLLPEFRQATVISVYVSLPAEVQTLDLIQCAWDDGKLVVVPCCAGNKLRLFHATSMSDLAPRTLGILEPRLDLWQCAERWLDPARVDLFVVPGVAFDRRGGRLGYGKGYYDRLLSDARQGIPKIALAFTCQMIDRVPMMDTDIRMDSVITEQEIYRSDRP